MQNGMHILAGRPFVMVKRPQFRRTLIREWRQHREMTLEQLAEAVDTQASHLSMLERGLRGYTQEMLEAIATALGTDAGSLLTRRPTDSDIYKLLDQAQPAQREQIAEMARIIVRTPRN